MIVHGCPDCASGMLCPKHENMTSKTDPNVATDVTETLIERFRGRIKHSDVCRVHRWGDCDCDREQLQTELAQLLSALQQQLERAQDGCVLAAAKITFIAGADIPETIEAARAQLVRRMEAAEQQRDEARRMLDGYQEREAACCPEDVGFEEFIPALQKRAEAAAAENLELKAKQLEGWDHKARADTYFAENRALRAAVEQAIDEHVAPGQREPLLAAIGLADVPFGRAALTASPSPSEDT